MTRAGVMLDETDIDSISWSQRGVYEVPETARGINLEFEEGHKDRQIGDSSVGLDLSSLRREIKLSIPREAHYVCVSENRDRMMERPDKPLIRISYLNSEKKSIDFSEQTFDNLFDVKFASDFVEGAMRTYSSIKPYASGNFPKQ